MMSLLAVIAVGPIGAWLAGIYGALLNGYGQLIGGILGIPFGWLYYLIFPFNL
jgi:hypothetical protein